MGDAGPLTATQIYRRDSTGIVAINAVTSEGETAGGSGAEVGGSGVEGGIEGDSGARGVEGPDKAGSNGSELAGAGGEGQVVIVP